MQSKGSMEEEDLADLYRQQAAASMEAEATKRIAEVADPARDTRLQNTPLADLMESDELVAAIMARLGMVRAALEGHGGGIEVTSIENDARGIDLILNLDGACIACGAAPGTLQGIQSDLLAGGEVYRVRFAESLLDTFDELGREFVLAHGGVTFV
jgi:Fe-S cluster biogenesis protein NfuA